MLKNTTLRYSVLIAMLCIYNNVHAEPDHKQTSSAPTVFIENKGQITDQNMQPRPDVDFRVPAQNGLNIFVGDGAIHYQFAKETITGSIPNSAAVKKGAKASPELSFSRIDMTLVGANLQAKYVTEMPGAYEERYFIDGSDAHGTEVKSYDKVTYLNVYPGIDWVLYTRKGKLKQEFIVHEGANAGMIKMLYSGSTGLNIAADGSLTTDCQMGTISESAPYSYQRTNGQSIATSYRKSGDTISFTTAPYKGELVIDPDVAWATYYGGAYIDMISSIATDNAGYIYACGTTQSNDNIVTAGAHNVSAAIYYTQAFLLKMSKEGIRQWATYYGVPFSHPFGYDIQGVAIATDNAGHVYIAGTGVDNALGVVTSGAFRTTPASGDGFIARFNSYGVREWGTYYGRPSTNKIVLTTDAANNLYVAMSVTAGIIDETTPGVHQTAVAGSSDVYLSKFNSTGTRQWATYFGGASGDEVNAIHADAAGAVYISGTTYSTSGIASPGAFQTSLSGTNDAFLAKFNTTGTRAWSSYYGGERTESGIGVATDGSGNVYLGGHTSSLTGISTPGSYQESLQGVLPFPARDFYLVKFTGSGSRTWATYFGKAGNETMTALNIDATGNIYIAGNTESDTGMVTDDAFRKVMSWGDEGILARFSTDGIRTWASYFGSDGTDNIEAMDIDADGSLYIAGNTTSSYNLATWSAHQVRYNSPSPGLSDGFIARINPGINKIMGNTQICPSSATTLTNSTPGGTWSSSSPHVATIGSSTGIITGISDGIAIITYTLPSGTFTTKPIYNTSLIRTFAGTGAVGYSGDGGQAREANVPYPHAVRCDAAGNVYIMSEGRIRKTDISGNITTIAGTGAIGFSGDGGAATSAEIYSNGDIATDAAGNVYITDPTNNRVRKINTSGIITTIAGGGASTANGVSATTVALSAPLGITTDAAGNIYVAESGAARIRKIDVSGTISLIAGNGTFSSSGDGGPATNAGFSSLKGITMTPSGDLLLVEHTYDGRIRKINTSGIITTIAGGSTGTEDGIPATNARLYNPLNITRDPDGNIFFTEHGRAQIRVIDTSGKIHLISGQGDGGYSGDDIPNTWATLSNELNGIASDAAGNIYIADEDNHRVRVIQSCPPAAVAAITGTRSICVGAHTNMASTTTGGTWSSSNPSIASINTTSGYLTGLATGSATITYTTAPGVFAITNVYVGVTGLENIAGTGIAGNSGDGGLATNATLNAPMGMTIDAIKNKYILSANVLRKVDIYGQITTIAGNATGGTYGDGAGYAGDGGPATSALMQQPSGVAIDELGNVIYIADRKNNRIRKLAGHIITTILGDGSYSTSGDGGPAILATCAYPSGIVVDNAGNVYFTDQGAGRVRKINTSGIVSIVAGAGGFGYSGDGGPATAALLNQPYGLAIDAANNLYVGDQGNHRIRKINTTTGIITTVAGNGVAGNSGDGGPATAASLIDGSTLATDINGNLYIANNRLPQIRKVGTDGIINPIAGNGIWGNYPDGVTATGTNIDFSYGIACDTGGNVYFTQFNFNNVKKIVSCSGNDELPTIIGTRIMCDSSTITLSNTVPGGTWSSTNGGITPVDATSCTLSSYTPATGTITVTYTLGGASTTAVVTVVALPGTISGTTTVCEGATTTLSSSTPGGEWSSTSANATTSGTTGIITGVSTGTATISYTMGGCATGTTVTVQNAPANIIGITGLCTSNTTILNSTPSGGTWTSSSTATGTIDATSGILTGIASGITTVSYTLTNGCRKTQTVTVNETPTTITGTATICSGTTATLTCTPTGGSWTSNATGIVSVGSATGIITGGTDGTATITYSLGAGCSTTTVVTTTPSPASITGTASVCAGNTITLSSTPTGGTWTSSSTATGTIDATSGMVTGTASGTTIISYTLANGCRKTQVVTVNETPAAITGMAALCPGTSATLASTPAGGSWTSSATGIVSAGATTGVITGGTDGTATITYTLSSGCSTTAVATTNPLPATITGTASVCTGNTTTLSSTPAGGTWTSSSAATGTVSATSGIMSGIASGTTTISYTLPSGCRRTQTVTVNETPAAISGMVALCPGTTATLTSTPAGGSWTSSATGIVSAGATTGIITGGTDGTATITYALATGCSTNAVATTNPLPAAITGTMTLCSNTSTTLSSTTTGGTWSSVHTTIATAATSGVISGVAAGTATISYTGSNGCAQTTTVTVNAAPAPITGADTVCASGATTTLATTSTGGVWLSDATSIATVGALTGVVTSGVAGTATISYEFATGCRRSVIVTVNPLPAAITGTAGICNGSSVTFTNTTTGGTWSSSTTTHATIGITSGMVMAISPGATTISYKLPTGCYTTFATTVNPLPAAIGGTMTLCAGNTTTLTDATTGGTWVSGTTSIATIGSATGIVNGVAAGTSAITYISAEGCPAMATITVNPLPATPAGTMQVCTGSTTTLTDITSGGTWASSNATIASIDASTGVATGVSEGTATISYILVLTGCTSTATLTVNLTPAAISGPSSVCMPGSGAYTDATGGGTWVSSLPAIATIDAATGALTAAATGIVTISYVMPTGCYNTRQITVNPVPEISGSTSLCRGAAATLSSLAGGLWSSSNASVATVGSASGVVTGTGYGTAIVTYTMPTGCLDTAIMSVDTNLVLTVTGEDYVCIGTPLTLSSTPAGGSWSSSNTSLATVSGTGEVTGIAGGTVVISYSLSNICGTFTQTKSLRVYTVAQCDSITSAPDINIAAYGTELFPNPNNGSFTLVVHSSESAPYQYHIVDVAGRVVWTGNGKTNTAIKTEINLAPGSYTLVVVNEQGRRYVKFVCLTE